MRTWHSRCPQGRRTALHPRASRCRCSCRALTPRGSFFHPCQRPPGGDLCFHGLLSQVSVVSDETRSASQGSPAGLLQVTA